MSLETLPHVKFNIAARNSLAAVCIAFQIISFMDVAWSHDEEHEENNNDDRESHSTIVHIEKGSISCSHDVTVSILIERTLTVYIDI